jgi:signal transduction histidine kinase
MGVFHPLKNDFVWLLVNSAPRYHPNGELTEVIVTFEDITELTITGSGIKVREEKYRLLFDNMPAGIMVCEVSFDSIGRPFDCHFIGGNLAFELKTGRKASEQMGKDAAHLPLKWPQGVLEKCYEVAVTGKPVNFELYDEHLQKYFKTRIFSPRYGQFAYVFYDITERKTAEKELGKSEHFNKEILRSLKSKLAVIDKHGQIITTNEAWNNYTDEEDETNFRKNELESNYFADCEIASNAGDNVARVTLEAMKKVLSGELSHFYLEYPRPTLTSERWYSLAIMKFRNDEPMIVCLYEDISARKTAEIEREKAINDIVARNKNLKQFSYIVSHNLRAPVANIMGISRFLQQDTKSLTEDDTTGLINGLITSVDKLDIVIQDLNAVLQIRNQSSEIKDQISLTQLVQDIKTSIAGTLKATKTKINVDFREVDKITTVKSYLYSIIYNLISNSIKYRREKVAPVISITTHRTAAQIELIIQDNGMGIDMKKYGDQLFGLYKRFHYHTDGKGVGLFMVKTQIESLGGKIRVESVVNEGTTFYISFEN